MLTPDQLQNLELLGQGPGTRVYRALCPEAEPVLLKRFSLSEAPDWKAQELFVREAQVLQQLEHPGLPRLLAWGQDEREAWLICAFIPGESLAAKLSAGWRPSLAELLDLARQLLELLAWLHAHQPPLVHRDVKPSNLILDPDGRLHLIDFGSVLRHLKPAGGSTVAGTFGYMAPEQFSGRALPASDLYATGATLIHLLTGLPPAELPQERLRIRFEAHLDGPEALKVWLRSLIQPLPEDRCPDAATALASLKKLTSAPGALTPAVDVPALPGAAQGRLPAPFRPGAALATDPPDPPRRMRALEVHDSPGHLDLLLPPRALHGSSLKFYVATSALGSAYILLMSTKIFVQLGSFAPTLQLPALVLLLCLASVGALLENRRMQRLIGTETRLRADAEGLRIEETRKDLSLSRRRIPWTALEGLHQHGKGKQGWSHLRLDYRAEGRKRSLRLGQVLEPEEVAWLTARLLSCRDRFAPLQPESGPLATLAPGTAPDQPLDQT